MAHDANEYEEGRRVHNQARYIKSGVIGYNPTKKYESVFMEKIKKYDQEYKELLEAEKKQKKLLFERRYNYAQKVRKQHVNNPNGDGSVGYINEIQNEDAVREIIKSNMKEKQRYKPLREVGVQDLKGNTNNKARKDQDRNFQAQKEAEFDNEFSEGLEFPRIVKKENKNAETIAKAGASSSAFRVEIHNKGSQVKYFESEEEFLKHVLDEKPHLKKKILEN